MSCEASNQPSPSDHHGWNDGLVIQSQAPAQPGYGLYRPDDVASRLGCFQPLPQPQDLFKTRCEQADNGKFTCSWPMTPIQLSLSFLAVSCRSPALLWHVQAELITTSDEARSLGSLGESTRNRKMRLKLLKFL